MPLVLFPYIPLAKNPSPNPPVGRAAGLRSSDELPGLRRLHQEPYALELGAKRNSIWP